MSAEAFAVLSSNTVWPIIEFATITTIVLLSYLAMHNMFSSLKPGTKMLAAMFLGTVGYSAGKLILFVVFLKPMLQL